MEAVQLNLKMLKRKMAQSVDGREPVAGYTISTPYFAPPATVCFPDNEDPFINIQHQTPCKGVSYEGDANLDKFSATSNASLVSMQSEDESTMVVDMGHAAAVQQFPPVENLVSSVRAAGLSSQDCNIKFRKGHVIVTDSTDLQWMEQPLEVTEKKGGYVVNGDEKDICQLLNEQPASACKGVICNSQVLCSEAGDYAEGLQYKVYPDTKSKGAYGEAAMCQDLNSGKTFLCKTVHGQLFKNEVIVPMMFRGSAGIPEIYGVVRKGQTTAIFQEFAGLPLEKLCMSEYGARLRDPGILLGLAFQGFTTLDKLHSQGIQHLDIKPQNLCVDLGQKAPRLKLIDFGSSQLPGEVVKDGLTYEYLSPESCYTVLRVATKQQKEGRLESGADVWAMALSLLYCLCGYHLMVYACTGDVVYHETRPEKRLEQRIKCLFQICKMTDADIMAKLIRPDWPEVLKVLFINTLRVNPEHRWSAGQAASFILDYLKTVAQKSSAAEPAVSVSGPMVGPSRLRVRVLTTQVGTQNWPESQPVQWNMLTPSRAPLSNGGHPVPHSHSKMETQTCKRKCLVQPVIHGYKILKK